MIHLKRLGIGFVVGAITFGLGYGLTDFASNVGDGDIRNAAILTAEGLAVVVVSYIVGWIIVDK